ncbi:unnamed protein product, partial [Brassica rapa subsp. narinosa]
WSLVSSSHRLAPSSPSRARSVVTVSNSLRRHCIELAPSSLYRARSIVNVSSSLRRQWSQARSVTTTLELAPKIRETRTNRTITRGTRSGIDGEKGDLIDFGSEHNELRVSIEREAATIAWSERRQ